MSRFSNSVNSLILIILAQANAQDICGKQSYGASEAEAEQRAAASLAQAISSSVSYSSKMLETIDGAESSQKDTTKSSIRSKLLNAQKAKYAKGRDAEGYFSTACMGAKDAAKPYLDSLRFLVGVLRESNCEKASEAYKNIAGLEGIIAPLGEMSAAIQKEYEAEYAKANNECGPAGKGVYLEVKETILGSESEVIKRKLEELLSQGNCRVESKAKAASFVLKVQAKDCNYKHDGTFDHCGSCAQIDLADGRNKKGGLKASVAEKAAFAGREAACEKAAELAAPEIWAKVKETIKEACN